jgi:pyrroline-5-carboxylate reductase
MKQFAPVFSKKHSEGEYLNGYKPLDVQRVSFIGGGNMAEAIITGIMTQGMLPASKLCVSEPSPGTRTNDTPKCDFIHFIETREKFERMDIPTVDENKKALVDADVVFVAVKPQILEHVCT